MDNGKACGHVQNVQFATVQKRFKTSGFKKCCGLCGQQYLAVSQSASLWLCLTCGYELCEQDIKRHAVQDFGISGSGVHALAMDTATFTVRCFRCIIPIEPQKDTTLNEIVEFCKHQAGVESVATFLPEADEQESMEDKTWSYMRGILNPGHRYPLNAFLQCLARSSFFMIMVKQSLVPAVIEIPGGEVKLTEEVKILLPSIKVKTPRIVDETLENIIDIINELTCGESSIVSPVKLDEFHGTDMHPYAYIVKKLAAVLQYPRDTIREEIKAVLPDHLINQEENFEAIISKYQQTIKNYEWIEMSKFGYSIQLIEEENREEKTTIYSYLKANLATLRTPRLPNDGVGEYTTYRNCFLVPPLILTPKFSKHCVDDFKTLSFPFILNLTPFCCPSINTSLGKKPILYELFGIIKEKDINRYAAYVKVRTPPLKQDTVKIEKMIKNLQLHYSKIIYSQEQEEYIVPEPESIEEPEPVDVQPSPGKWYYAQDTYVREVTEEEVLRVRPYSLFYERLINLPDC
ncbi:ubiquitin carboxyl-terminal hydrolase 16-like protein [Anopheles sinensis]|uniref:Ubiquitin carboxyl-terminal hydrolase 16-like protein n=1 Tax=Anopheles sinensis TaxID=74873 RepID=A0A084WHI1_ANOSI|nr:ubiquitin carboxyl-terminal hydrolase 16-like protein [Anopheles sinensis]